jgi:glycosyltransferase involved in cell wall biosynthesis
LKLLYIHQYFKTPDEGGANRSYYMAKSLVEAGHEVTMLTAHNETAMLEKNVDGIKTVYLPVNYSNTFSFWKRVKAFFSFVQKSKRWLRKNHNFDKCIATSTPLTVGKTALWLKSRYSIPYIFEVRDLWPEAPIQMGVVKNKFLKDFLKNTEKDIYKESERIIALSPGMRNHIEATVKNKEVQLIPNVADCDFFGTVKEKDPDLELHFGVKNKFVISYFGAVGPVNDLMSLIRCAQYFKDLPVRFLIMGQGKSLPETKQYVKEHELSNVFFIPYGTKEDVKDLLNVTDACYVSFLHKPVLRTNSPNKFFDAIASGKMIITNIQGWIRGLVEKRNFGIYADSDIPSELREKIIPFINSPELLAKYQNNARTTAEQFFERKDLADQFVAAVEGKSFKKMQNNSIFTLSA